MQGEGTLGNFSRTGSRLANEHRFTHQVLDADVGLLSDGVIWVRDHHELVLTPGYHVYRLVRNGTLDQRDVGARFEEEPEHRACVGARRADPDRGVAEMEAPENGRQHVGGDRSARGDPERTALETSELTELALGDFLDAE